MFYDSIKLIAANDGELIKTAVSNDKEGDRGPIILIWVIKTDFNPSESFKSSPMNQ